MPSNFEIYLIHRTNVCPVPQMKIGGVNIDPETGKRTPSNEFTRITLHWSLMNYKPNIGYKVNGKAVPLDITNGWGKKQATYIAVEPLAIMQELIVGGWINDFYMIGPYT